MQIDLYIEREIQQLQCTNIIFTLLESFIPQVKLGFWVKNMNRSLPAPSRKRMSMGPGKYMSSWLILRAMIVMS